MKATPLVRLTPNGGAVCKFKMALFKLSLMPGLHETQALEFR